MQVSVVIPAYKSEATIKRAIDSALAQTLSPHEIIVIDDGGPIDVRPQLRARYGDRVRCVRQENAGAAAARNAGIALATGDWIAFLDADDTWEPMRLARQAAIVARFPDVGLVASQYYKQTPGGPRAIEGRVDELWLDAPVRTHGVDLIKLGSQVWTGTVLVKRTVLADERFVSGLEPAEDRDLWIRILTKTDAYVIRDPLATAVLVPNSLSRTDADSGYGPMIRVLERHAHRITPRERRKLEAFVCRGWAAAHLARGFARRAIRPAARRLCLQPLSLEAWWIILKSVALSTRKTSNIVAENKRDCPSFSSARQDKELRRLSKWETRDRGALLRHFQIERELADRLRAADAEERRTLYGEVYNELFARVADHPQNTRKHDPSTQRAAADRQWKLLQNFVTAESTYLEVGAGDCHLTMDIARRARRAYGVDVSNVIASNDHTPDNFSLIISDGTQIDVPPASVNVAYSNQLMEHLHPDDAAAQLQQIRRALAPGGRYVVVTPHRFSGPHDISKFFSDRAEGFHLKEYTYRELRDLFLACGFAKVRVWTGLKGRFFPLPTSLIVALESILARLPHGVRRAITRSAPMRPVFINVMIAGEVASTAPRNQPAATPASDEPISSTAVAG